MTEPVLTLEELCAWCDEAARNWFTFLAAHSQLQTLPCGIYATDTVLGLVRHIVAAEVRYGQRLNGEVVTPYDSIPGESLDVLRELHRSAMDRIHLLLADDGQNWSEMIEVVTLTAGTQRASRRKILAHALVHAIRHWAQLATLCRAAGAPPDFPGDLLVSSALA